MHWCLHRHSGAAADVVAVDHIEDFESSANELVLAFGAAILPRQNPSVAAKHLHHKLEKDGGSNQLTRYFPGSLSRSSRLV